jgi:xanthine dehydrogenase small subunit
MRNTIVVYVNGLRCELSPEESFMTLSDFLRYQKSLTGTKVVCAEGDCGACTVLVKRFDGAAPSRYDSINSCIAFMWQLDLSHIISVEGLKRDGLLHPVQEQMIECHGAQCGYCTPGFICAMASLSEDAKIESFEMDKKRVQNYLTGNLCRCTGYDSIIEAGMKVDLAKVLPLKDYYDDEKIAQDLTSLQKSVRVAYQEKIAFIPTTMTEAIKSMSAGQKIVSGSTDLGVLHNKGKWQSQEMISLKSIPELHQIKDTKNELIIGARVTLKDVEAATKGSFPAFSDLMHIFASPQIKNSATLVGNMMNASPIADTIPFLKVAEAVIVIESPEGQREMNINDFFLDGYKQMQIKTGEFVSHVKLPKTTDQFKLYKVSKRKDLDISAVTLAIRYELSDEVFTKFSIAIGGVAASVLRLKTIEGQMIGQKLSKNTFEKVAQDVQNMIKPLSDVRGSADYRKVLTRNLLMKFYHEVSV